jgi:excisionase family DNA binding protein
VPRENAAAKARRYMAVNGTRKGRMTAHDRLAAFLAPDVLEALEDLVAERVADALAQLEPSSSPWLSVDAAAVYASVSARTVERAIARGQLKSDTVGSRRLVHREAVDKWIEAGTGGDVRTAPRGRPRGEV